MGSPVLKVGSLDLSSYLDIDPDKGMDPTPGGVLDGQYTGLPAAGEGQRWVADTVNKREMPFPLKLNATTRAKLRQLEQSIELAAVRGAQVEYAVDDTDEHTFFDLERGVLDTHFNQFLQRNNWGEYTLRLVSRPFAHSGTSRTLASVVLSAPTVLTLAGINGDIPAQLTLKLQPASHAVMGQFKHPILAWGVKYPVPSGWTPIYHASALGAATAGVPAALTGASGRIASQYVAYNVAAASTGVQNIFSIPLRTQDAGNYRIFAIARHLMASSAALASARVMLSPGMVGISASTRKVEIPLASIRPGGGEQGYWTLVDGGNFTIDDTTTALVGQYAGAAGASNLASFPLHIDGVVMVPLDTNAGLLNVKREPFGADSYTYEFDSITRTVKIKTSSSHPSLPNRTLSDETGRLRGDFPKAPAAASSAASGPAQMVILGGYQVDTPVNANTSGSQTINVQVGVRERFRFLR